MSRPRTTKELAKRIELGYYRRLHPWRRWRRNASAAAVALAAVWLMGSALRGDRRLYNSGPVSAAHTVFAPRCGACHVPAEASRFWLQSTDRACLVCHDGPAHHVTQTFTPQCATCHVEHKGHVVLADLSDPHCTRCHQRLSVANGAPQFETRISDFGADHPEFAVLRNHRRDGAQVHLNHEVHLKPGLRGPNGPVQMVCSDCHRAGSPVAAWPYQQNTGPQDTAQPASAMPYVRGRYMNRIDYARHCSSCHPLDFDARVRTAAPHVSPERIRGFLRLTYIDYAAQQPEELSGSTAEEEEAGGLRRRHEEGTAGGSTPEQWIPAQVAAAENALYHIKNKGCLLCHVLGDGDDLPKVASTAIPQQWLGHAVFDHRTHRELRCLACHGAASTSRDSADVLLPGIDTCRKCHVRSGGARAGCVECHVYHDKARERDPNGPLLVKDLAVNG